jgi:serine/threonine-protein kinase
MPHDRDLIGTVLDGRYELRSLLGEGAFGRVYLGRDRRLARIVAVKVIKPCWAQDPQWVDSFLGEARLMARASDPGIVQIFDVGRASEGPYYVAEFVDGESLASRLRHGPLPASEAWEIAEQLCRALGQAHEQLIVHRDIKPANILISARNRVKVGDFGVARLAEATNEVPSDAVLGTPRYMAPEHARGLRTTPAADVYSIGVVLYEMLAGRTPFEGRSAVEMALAHEQNDPPPLPPAVPDPLARVVERSLHKDPEARYADANAMARALARARQRADDATPALIGAGARSAAGDTALVAAVGPPSERVAGSGTRLTQALTPSRSRPGAHRAGGAGILERPRRPTGHIEQTRIAPERRSPADAGRSSARPSRLALVLLALGLMAAGFLAFRALTAPALVRVPDLHGLRVRAVLADMRRAGLSARLTHAYSAAPAGTAISQNPASGARIDSGSSVQVVISKGAPPVEVPRLVGSGESQARSILGSLHLASSVTAVPAPGTAAGTVVAQSPSAGRYIAAHHAVSLQVAEVPQWRTVTTFSGSTAGASVPFQIRGRRWRALYTMAYAGTCTFIIFCEGPSANVLNVSSGRAINQFGLNAGTDQSQVFGTGPGIYQIKVSQGMDSAQWSVDVQDYY